VIVERDWLEGKLVSLDLSIKKEMADKIEGIQAKQKNPSITRQLELLKISKTAHYYEPVVPFESEEDIKLLNMIDKIHTKHPYYGTRRVAKLLHRLKFKVGRKHIKRAFEFMGIKALYPKVRTTIANKEHIDILVKHDISISMDAKGRSIDNIVIERFLQKVLLKQIAICYFWRSLKYEDVYPSSYTNIKEARAGIEEYINIYNKERLHLALDYLTPDEVYFKGANNRSYKPKEMLHKVA